MLKSVTWSISFHLSAFLWRSFSYSWYLTLFLALYSWMTLRLRYQTSLVKFHSISNTATDTLVKDDSMQESSPPQLLQLLVVSLIHPLDIVHVKEKNLKGTRHPPLLLHGTPHLSQEEQFALHYCNVTSSQGST